jgi:hypothetical protein
MESLIPTDQVLCVHQTTIEMAQNVYLFLRMRLQTVLVQVSHAQLDFHSQHQVVYNAA